MKINGTDVFKHQFWLLRDNGVMLVTDICEGEHYPIKGVRAVFDELPAFELSWTRDGMVARTESDIHPFDMVRQLTDFQMRYEGEPLTHEPDPAVDFERDGEPE